jgi:hypothetical protein
VKSYIDYLENSWLFFVVNKYAFSVKEQQIAAKKIYGVDTGLIKSVGFAFSQNLGKAMENAVYLHLRRRYQDIYYYKTAQNYEVDFFLPKENIFVQSSYDFDVLDVRERELRALVAAAEEKSGPVEMTVVAARTKETIKQKKSVIQTLPLYEWLLR